MDAMWMVREANRTQAGFPALVKAAIDRGGAGRPFRIVKFRTRLDARDERGQLLPDEQRLTPFGRFLRSASLDELPQLRNVRRGELSLVGPRPLVMQYLGRYSPRQARRHEVMPGIAGHATMPDFLGSAVPRRLP